MRFNPKKHHLPPLETSAVLLVDKPAGWTSFDVVNFVRCRFNIPKVGHCGTLDPAATGLLVLVLNKFTRLSGSFTGDRKCYEATLKLGLETDSYDLDGTVTATYPWEQVTEEQLRTVLSSFIGPQKQMPPMVSAAKVGGKKLYELARQGVEVEREEKDIEIFQLDVTRVALPECDFSIEGSKGFFVRSICFDAGRRLGCGGTLAALRRTKSGAFDLADAVTVETLKTWEQADLEIHLRKFLFEKVSKLAGMQL